ncbi:lysine--tRNA ligase [Tanacetum coccineum]
MGDANGSCVGDFVVYLQVGNTIWNFTTRSIGVGSSEKHSVTFKAEFSHDEPVPISFYSFNETRTSDHQVFCGPVIDGTNLRYSSSIRSQQLHIIFMVLSIVLSVERIYLLHTMGRRFKDLKFEEGIKNKKIEDTKMAFTLLLHCVHCFFDQGAKPPITRSEAKSRPVAGSKGSSPWQVLSFSNDNKISKKLKLACAFSCCLEFAASWLLPLLASTPCSNLPLQFATMTKSAVQERSAADDEDMDHTVAAVTKLTFTERSVADDEDMDPTVATVTKLAVQEWSASDVEDMDPTMKTVDAQKDARVKPYTHFKTTSTISEFIKDYEKLRKGERLEDVVVSLAGRIMSKRCPSSKLYFYDLHGSGVKVQVMVDAK